MYGKGFFFFFRVEIGGNYTFSNVYVLNSNVYDC